MKFGLTTLLLAISTLVDAVPQPHQGRQDIAVLQTRQPGYSASDITSLFRRKGGGGAGGRGGGSSSSGSGESSSGSGSSSAAGSSSEGGSSSGGSSSSGSRPAGSSTSNTGGRSSGGTGVAPAYGGGRYYAGGAAVPYTSGGRTPGGLVPGAFLGVGALAFFPGLWLYPAYLYSYPHPYSYYNVSSAANETKPVSCLCQEYQECSCDDNSDSAYLDDLVGNGSVADWDSTVTVAPYNGTSTIFVNGTLDNGTAASSAASVLTGGLNYSGYWVMTALVVATVMMV